MGILSLGYAEKLIMGFGAQGGADHRPRRSPAGLLLFTRAPVDGNYWTDVFPVMVLLGLGAGPASPR